MKKILLLGGSGTLSAAVMREALKRDFQISVFNRGNNNKKIPRNVDIYIGDFKKHNSITQAFKDKTFDVVVDFLSRTPQDINRTYQQLQNKCKQYVFISSACVYCRADEDFPVKEFSPKPNRNWSYNIEKYGAEQELIKLSKNASSAYTIVRPYITYDNNRIPFGIAPEYKYHRTIIERIRSGKPMFIWNNGETITTATHTSDFAKAVVGLFLNIDAFNEDFHITSDNTNRIDDVLMELYHQLGYTPNIVQCSNKAICKYMPNYSRMLEGDRKLPAIFDNSKIKKVVKDLSFDVTLTEGIEMVINNYMNSSTHEYDYRYDAQIDRLLMYYGVKTSYIQYPNDTVSHRCIYILYKYLPFCLSRRIVRWFNIK